MKREGSLILSLDIGTSSTRALFYDSLGHGLPGAEAQVAYNQTTTADGGVETDAAALYNRTLTAIRQLFEKSQPTRQQKIAGVAVSCFWHSLMGVGEDMKPVTPLYSWADTRARAEAAGLAQKLDPVAYHARTGCFFHPSYWPAKLLWLQKTHPGDFAKARYWVSFAEYMYLRLFGQARCSLSMASATGLFDQNEKQWDEEILGVLPVTRENLLPLAYKDDPQTGMPSPPRGLESLRDTPWFAAIGDGATSNLGAGGASEKCMVINLGTSGAIRVMTERDRMEIAPGLFCYRADGKRFLVGGAVSNAGNVYAWLVKTLQIDERPADMERRLARAEPDAHGLTVMPFWAGERSPGWHIDARASILGLNLHTSPLDIIQASLEAVAYTFADIRSDLLASFPDASQIVVSGGALEHSPAWAQMFADVLGAPVQVSRTSEPSGRGAALFALDSLGLLPVNENLPDTLGKTRNPDPRRHAAYQKSHARYRSYYDRLIVGG